MTTAVTGLLEGMEGRPPSELPIWARLKFQKMIPATYFTDEERIIPRNVKDAVITGFVRVGNTCWIYFDMAWLGVTHHYLWPCDKQEDD